MPVSEFKCKRVFPGTDRSSTQRPLGTHRNVCMMSSRTATALAIFLLVSSVHSDHPCTNGGEDCHKETGKDVLLDELAAIGVPPSQFQKDFPEFCDPSTPGTGHGLVLARSLSPSLEISEQCYSLCFSNVSSTSTTVVLKDLNGPGASNQ